MTRHTFDPFAMAKAFSDQAALPSTAATTAVALANACHQIDTATRQLADGNRYHRVARLHLDAAKKDDPDDMATQAERISRARSNLLRANTWLDVTEDSIRGAVRDLQKVSVPLGGDVRERINVLRWFVDELLLDIKRTTRDLNGALATEATMDTITKGRPAR